jgi:hypothetical protein
MKKSFLLLALVLCVASPILSQNVVFLHHSTGGNVFYDGNVADWFTNYNTANGTSYSITERAYPDSPYEWANYPYDFWNLWVNNSCQNSQPGIECLSSLAQNYQVIIFKHCFPGAGINEDVETPNVASSEKTIGNYKLQYRALRSVMDSYPNNKFIVWTLAPLHRNATNPEAAARAKEFVDWVKNSWLTEDGNPHPNIYIFDFFGIVAEQDPNPANGQVNCLKYDYEGSHGGDDSHPNATANAVAGPLFSQTIVDCIKSTPTGKVKTIHLATPGTLYSSLTSTELKTDSSLTITGTIDARDFKTMRDSMPLLASLDLRKATIVEYIGNEGTYNFGSVIYQANAIPQYAFYNNNTSRGKLSLRSIILPASIVSIGGRAFSNCTGLSSINLPAAVRSIGSRSFYYCRGLTSISIPSHVIFIGSVALGGCSSLTSIYASTFSPVELNADSYEVFSEVNKTTCTLFVPYGSKTAYQEANQWKDFNNIVEMQGVFLSANTLDFGKKGGEKKLKISSSVNWTATSSQSWLTVSPTSGIMGSDSIRFIITANPTNIIRTATATISSSGFGDQVITITQYGEKAVAVTAGGLHDLLAGELGSIYELKITGTIDARDFKTMRDSLPLLSEIDLRGATVVEYIGTGGTTGTNSITYPADAIPDYAFYYYRQGDRSDGKISLTSIILPPSITSIGNAAFTFCSGFTSLSIPSLVTTIGNMSFWGCNLTINIPSSVTSIELYAFVSFKGLIMVDEANSTYSSRDGVLFNKTQTTLIQCPVSKVGSYTIPSSVISIGVYAFYSCSGLSSVIIPEGVNSIGSDAFGYCTKLAAIAIPSSVRQIGDNAFRSCDLLASLTIHEGATSIGNNAFYDCSKLTSVNIPLSVTSISTGAFRDCDHLSLVTVNWKTPLNICGSANVFAGVDKTTCSLNVPYGSKSAYQAANQWKDFTNIQEMPGFSLSSTVASVAAKEGSTNSITITSNTTWTATSDQTWLTISPASGTNNGTLLFTASANTASSERSAIVTVSATGFPSQTITVTQAAGEAGVPSITALSGITLNSDTTTCYNATDSITIAGNGTTVSFESGSSVTLISGKSIRFLPGFNSAEGSFMSASITTNNTFCNSQSGSIVEQPQEKSVTEETIPEDHPKEIAGVNSIKVFPNPNTGNFTVQTSVEGESRLTVTSLSGQMVYGSVGFTENIRVQLTGLSKGIYLCRIQNKQEVQVRKIEVK